MRKSATKPIQAAQGATAGPDVMQSSANPTEVARPRKKTTPGKLAHIDRQDILNRIYGGELPTRIADDLGVHKSAITLKYGKDPEYMQAREVGMEIRLDDGEKLIEDAGDDLNLARAREIAQRRREWRAEREFPHRWGQKNHLTVENVGDLGDRLRRSRERVIDAEVTEIQQDAAQQQPELDVSDAQQIIEK